MSRKTFKRRRIEEDFKEPYPHVVIRYLASVYDRRRVVFVDGGAAPSDTDVITVVCPRPYRDGNLTARAAHALITTVRELSWKTHFRTCIVWRKNGCLYVAPDGRLKELEEPPSGGINCLSFPLEEG